MFILKLEADSYGLSFFIETRSFLITPGDKRRRRRRRDVVHQRQFSGFIEGAERVASDTNGEIDWIQDRRCEIEGLGRRANQGGRLFNISTDYLPIRKSNEL